MKLNEDQRKGLAGFHLIIVGENSSALYDTDFEGLPTDAITIEEDWVSKKWKELILVVKYGYALRPVVTFLDGKQITMGNEPLKMDLTNPIVSLTLNFPNNIIDPVTIPFKISPLKQEDLLAISLLDSIKIDFITKTALNVYYLDPTHHSTHASLHLHCLKDYEAGTCYSQNNEPFIIKDVASDYRGVSAEITLFDKDDKELAKATINQLDK
jgi:hypothetical protein